MSDRPHLSVVIPTRERASTLLYAIRSALAQATNDYEVLVCDNASQDATPGVVAGFADARLRYVRTPQRLSMSENWEFALGHVRGRYVTYIGDDDAVLPNAVDRLVRLFVSRPSRAYMWTTPIYTWPLARRRPEATYLPARQGVNELDLKRMAKDVMRHGGWRYYALPGAYHAAIERDVLHDIARAAGRTFLSTQPDLFTSMAVPAFVDRAIHTGRPVTLSGRSAHSNGAALVTSTGVAALEKYLKEYGPYSLHPSLSNELPISCNLVFDAFLVVRDAFPGLYGGIPFNYEAGLAFLCKWGHLSAPFVLSRRSRLRHWRPFNASKFLAWILFFQATALRRRLLNLAGPAGPKPPFADDAFGFARAYDESLSARTPSDERA